MTFIRRVLDTLLLLEKAEVQHPGARGGHPWLNEKGEYEYGLRPKGKTPTMPSVAPKGRIQKNPNLVLNKPKGQDEVAASVAALDYQDKQRDTSFLPSTPQEYRADLLRRIGEPATSKRLLTPAPTLAMEWAHDNGKGVAKMFNTLNPAVRDEALGGMQHVERNFQLAKDHALTPRAVLLHFVWSILAKSSEPYAQESAYIDLEHSGINYFIDKAIAGKFDSKEFRSWLGANDNNVLVPDATKQGYLQRPAGDPKKFKGLAEGSPGRQVTMNVNAIDGMLSSWSKLGTKGLTDLYTDPNVSGARARREFWRRGYQAHTGLNNKILSFATAMLGKPDVMVVDIWQARRFHPDAFKSLQEQYSKASPAEGKTKDGSMGKATVAIAKTYNDPAGLASYEAIEGLLGQAIKGFPVDKNGKIGGKVTPSVFALHWLSWVSNFDAAVGHHSMDTIQALAEEGLSARGQQRNDDTPTADDKLSELGQTHVAQGNTKVRTFGSKYMRGSVDPAELKYHASFVPTEFVPGSFPSPFGDWLKQQAPDVRAKYAFSASKALEPQFRAIAKSHGLAVSVNEGYGGFGGHGNANTQATLVPLDDKLDDQQTMAAVKGFASDLGWAFKQDMAVLGHMVPTGTKDSQTGYDFQLTRSLTPDEAEKLGAAAKRAMSEGIADKEAAADSDAGYSFLPNNRARFINFTGFSKAPMGDDEFKRRVAEAVEAAVPELVQKADDGSIAPFKFGWEGDAVDNDWQKDPEGHGYDEARNGSAGTGVQSAGSTQAGTQLASGLRTALEQFNEQFQKEQQQGITKSILFLKSEFPLSSETTHRMATEAWKGDKVRLNNPARRNHGQVLTVHRSNAQGVDLHDENGNLSTSMSREGWHNRIKEGVHQPVSVGQSPRKRIAPFAPAPPKVAPAPIDHTHESLRHIFGKEVKHEEIHKIYNGHFGKGSLEARVHSITPVGNSNVAVAGHFHDHNGEKVGNFNHVLTKDNDGHPAVINNIVSVHPSHQAQGTVSAFTHHAEQGLAHHGVKTMHTWAENTGKYTWAKDHKFMDNRSRQDTVDGLHKWLKKQGSAGIPENHSLRTNSDSSPADVAKYDDGKKYAPTNAEGGVSGQHHAGKAFLLSGDMVQGWHGKKSLTMTKSFSLPLLLLEKSHDVSSEVRDKEGKWTNNHAVKNKDFMAGKRGIDKATPYFVYLNLHLGTKKPLVSKKTGLPMKNPKTGRTVMVPDQKVWSLKNTKTKLVDAHQDTVYLKNVKMHIGEGGRRRVIDTGFKTVHAGIVGQVVSAQDVPESGWQDMHYSPKDHPELAHGFFMVADEDHPDQRISNAEYARFTPSGTQIIGPKYVHGTHDDDLYTGI